MPLILVPPFRSVDLGFYSDPNGMILVAQAISADALSPYKTFESVTGILSPKAEAGVVPLYPYYTVQSYDGNFYSTQASSDPLNAFKTVSSFDGAFSSVVASQAPLYSFANIDSVTMGFTSLSISTTHVK